MAIPKDKGQPQARFNTGSQLNDQGAQAKRKPMSDADMEDLARQRFMRGLGQAAGDDEAGDGGV